MLRRADFISAMRKVANSVTIVTTGGAAGRHGATVTAFCSVSAEPPSLLVCLRSDSRIAHTVLANRSFCVNVLRDSAAPLADRFAGHNAAPAQDRFAGVAVAPGTENAPRLADAVSAFTCTVANALKSGSHLVVLGHVRNVHVATELPLAYVDGGYAAVTRLPVRSIS